MNSLILYLGKSTKIVKGKFMAKNDIILIDSIISDRIGQRMPSADKGEVFEFLACEQILKDFDLTKDEILSGSVDGKDDGGIDSIFIFVNGNLLTDINDFSWPKCSCEISVFIITCKHHDTFAQEPLNNEYATVSEIFDLSKSDDDLKASYNEDVLMMRRLFSAAYIKTASYLDKLSFNFVYASRGDTQMIGENIYSRAEQIKDKMRSLFSNCVPNYLFFGSTEILLLYRKKPKYELNLYHNGIISYKEECHIVLCNLKDFFTFITDDDGKLKKYLFDSNVRDYMGNNSVNLDIMTSLKEYSHIDFWWLNNGITILARSAINVGSFIKVQDVQIVNGLQTSQTIFQYINSIKPENPKEERCVMIKIITQNNPEIRDNIIRSTNNQTAIMTKSLFATDKIQRDIEEVMRIEGFYYERRTNCYANKDIDNNLIFDIMYLSAAYLCLILKVPEKAANFKQKFLKRVDLYNELFSGKEDLKIWPKLAVLLRKTDTVLLPIIGNSNTEKMLKRSRYIVATIALGRLFGTYNYNVKHLLDLDISNYTPQLIEDTWTDCVSKWYAKESMLKRDYVLNILHYASALWKIKDFDSFAKRKNKFITDNNSIKQNVPVDEDTIQLVNNNLPPQPWKVGIHKEIAQKLGLKRRVVSSAINMLINRGIIYRQKDGVLYDKDWNIVSITPLD